MKIKKNKKLVEKLITEDEEVKTEGPQDLDTATPQDIEAGVEQAAAEAGVATNPAAVKKHAKVVWQEADLIENPYGAASINDAKACLQMSLEAALADRETRKAAGAGDEVVVGDYPNVLLYGLAGFAKTSIVKEFCKEHHLNLFECEAKTLDVATVGGIPYPAPDANGVLKQTPVASNYWDTLDRPNTVLFLDELNRARGNIIGSLLTLINEHTLPMFTKDLETGETLSNVKYFPDILFTVICINPADDVFEDNIPLDPAVISRNGSVIEQAPNTADFLKHLTRLYDAIANNKYLDPKYQARYAGQYAIAKKILQDKGFMKSGWDNADDVRTIFRLHNRIGNYLNYRSFMLVLKKCDGTKASYLRSLKFSGFQQSKIQIIENALADYTDIQTTGNNVFNKAAADPQKAAKAATDIASDLDAYINSLS